MTGSEFMALLRARFGAILASGTIVAVLTLGALLMTEKRYEARMDFLIVQRSTANASSTPSLRRGRRATVSFHRTSMTGWRPGRNWSP
jgi:uncharacterized protein involved in exopolysaccharide biosynthesis